MPANWEDVHYLQRPAKNIERKMLVDVLSRLERYRHLGEFHYIGFGSLYFVDFVTLHRRLGITRMTSIEEADDPVDAARVRFNKPFRFVDLRFGHSNATLGAVNWRRPSIVWLDYTRRVGDEAFADIETVVARAARPCVLLVTVNADPGPADGRLDRFREAVGDDRVPPGFESDASLARWGTAAAAHRVLTDEIDRRLSIANQLAGAAQRTSYRQIVHFRYQDKPRMLTTGGVLHLSSDTRMIEDCRIFDSPFAVPDGEPAFEIRVPNVTTREIQHMSQRMPKRGAPRFDRIGIRADVAEQFRQSSRYFPAFVDADLM
ncbi:MAG: hypothetical protein CYG61_05470 [Actinobacteria bacterium]|nr:MAG: hypothetical protein CYG61_05470 [Actinomycetota bacterium]